MIQARVDIGVTLLCHSGMCIVDIHVYLCTHLVYYAYLCIHLVDMKDRCVMCGARNDSINHPDYCDCVCVTAIAIFIGRYNYIT